MLGYGNVLLVLSLDIREQIGPYVIFLTLYPLEREKDINTHNLIIEILITGM